MNSNITQDYKKKEMIEYSSGAQEESRVKNQKVLLVLGSQKMKKETDYGNNDGKLFS